VNRTLEIFLIIYNILGFMQVSSILYGNYFIVFPHKVFITI
jgi:hypothetical protein